MTKPFKQRMQLIDEAFELMAPGAPFVQFTYAMVTPIPKALPSVTRRSLRADLAERAAGARLGLSQELIAPSAAAPACCKRWRRPAWSRPCLLPKILVFAGSIRTGSHNARLAALAAKELALTGADVTRISLEDYPLPIYDGDDEAKSGAPANARKLKQMMAAHQGVFIASPEYNASITPLLKNTIDWISRVRERGEPPLAVFKNRAFAIGGASDGPMARCAR